MNAQEIRARLAAISRMAAKVRAAGPVTETAAQALDVLAERRSELARMLVGR